MVPRPWAALIACLTCCLAAARGQPANTADGAFHRIAQLEDPEVAESSGVVASRQYPGVYWTHNDSGGSPVIYAFDRSGRSLGKWTIPGARNLDWEDIGIAPGPHGAGWYLYIGDIGDNRRTRREVVVYRIPEPKIAVPAACAKLCKADAPVTVRLRYPDGPHNCEALFVHPATNDLYLVTKAGGGDSETGVYVARARQFTARRATLTSIATLSIPDPLFRRFGAGITGADISPDGRRVALSDYLRVYEATLPAGQSFDQIWRQQFQAHPINTILQLEGVCYRADGKAILITAEGKPCPLWELVIDQ